MSKKKLTAIILATGKSTRFDPKNPKQYQPLYSKMVIEHSIDVFMQMDFVDEIIITYNENHINFVNILKQKYKNIKYLLGGKERQDSAKIAMTHSKNDFCLIHDAARPFVDKKFIQTIYDNYEIGIDCIVPINDLSETIFNINEKQYLNRDDIKTIQTPQLVNKNLALEYINLENNPYTDESSLFKKYNANIKYINGMKQNIKITHNNDLNNHKEYRTGFGYDIHSFVGGDHIMLGGVKINHTHGLNGHSDSDVLLHAITDAIYGSINHGDIGDHFPPTDDKFKNMDSAIFIKHAHECLKQQGGQIVNIDCTIVTEKPKLFDYKKTISLNIANILQIDPTRVSVKATTAEKLGFIGRSEGISTYANIMIRI